jgi:serine/threonine protein kinase/tetratricopeptide (TPR) repeat protein
MKTATMLCGKCGAKISEDATGQICPACLLEMGLGLSHNEFVADSTEIPAKFGDFEIARHEDGSFWELGRGGMGVTYRARDSVLHRSVALKVIEVPPGAGHSAVVRERFLREARAAAALRHPNVAAVYHFGMMPQPNRCYYAMELVEGETLEARVRREGPLQVTQLLDIGVQVTRALIAAANQGLIHRDLKPGNIMLTRSEDSSAGFEVKVIDFGLAKVIADAGGELDLTQGQFVGTPNFASPEQFESGPVDVRSDIYSLGATLWFALTGKPPFAGCKIEEIHVAQKSDALPIEQLKAAQVPSSLKSLLQSMLAFEPAARPGIKELATHLRHCSAAAEIELPPTPPDPLGRKTLAVLPIEDLHPDPENSWFADGLTQELINVLSQIERLRVRDRKSVKNYDTTGKSAQRMADELGVQYLLEGTVRILNKQMRITVALIDAIEGDHLWSQTFKGTMEDIFEIQEQLALEIAEALKIKLTLEERSSVGQRMTANMEAYERFVRAEEAMINQSPAALERAEHLLKEAVVLDPAFANAWALLAAIHMDSYWLYTRNEELLKSAEAEARTALLHDQDSALAHVQLGLVTARRGNRVEALKLAHEALRLDPNDGLIQLWRGHIYAALGDIDRGIETWEYAARLSPDNLMVLWALTFNYALWNEHKHLHAHAVKSLPFLERYVLLHPDDRSIRGEYIVSLAATGRVEEACRISENLSAEPSDEAAHLGGIAITFLLAGDIEQAIAVCERLSDLGMGLYMLLTPLFRTLRHHPKYRDLLKRARSKFARGCALPALTRFASPQQFVHRR